MFPVYCLGGLAADGDYESFELSSLVFTAGFPCRLLGSDDHVMVSSPLGLIERIARLPLVEDTERLHALVDRTLCGEHDAHDAEGEVRGVLELEHHVVLAFALVFDDRELTFVAGDPRNIEGLLLLVDSEHISALPLDEPVRHATSVLGDELGEADDRKARFGNGPTGVADRILTILFVLQKLPPEATHTCGLHVQEKRYHPKKYVSRCV